MKAIHSGQAKHAKIDAHKMAALLRGGMLPHASVYPAARRATRELLRRRTHLRRKRAELFAHVPHTTSQYHLPAMGQKIAYQTNRDGVAERFAAPAVQQTIAVAWALLPSDDARRTDLARAIVPTAKHHEAPTFSRLRSIPRVGNILALVLLSAMHAMHRFPSVQDFVSSCRLGTCARASAGTRSGPAGKQSGNAHLQWALAEAAVLFRRHHPAGQQ